MSPSKYPSHQAQELRKNDETNIVTGIRFWHPAPKSSHPPNVLWKSVTQPVHIWRNVQVLSFKTSRASTNHGWKMDKNPQQTKYVDRFISTFDWLKPNLFRNAVQVRIIPKLLCSLGTENYVKVAVRLFWTSWCKYLMVLLPICKLGWKCIPDWGLNICQLYWIPCSKTARVLGVGMA